MLLPPERTSYHSTAQVDCLTYCASVTLDLMHRHDVWPTPRTAQRKNILPGAADLFGAPAAHRAGVSCWAGQAMASTKCRRCVL